MENTKLVSTLFAAIAVLSFNATAQVNMAFSTVGNPGNPNDTNGYGGVSYNYAIGTYDVTVSQYTSFLNAVAATDTYNLYNTSMGTDLNIAGIARSGDPGSYSYSVMGTSGSNPITYVSWFDAARFTNWLCNGQPIGLQTAATTEAGAYTLSGTMSGGLSISKNVNAQYWIPSKNEWYKAAYYDPTLGSGSGGYWLYPTQSNSAPGNSVGSGANMANYYSGVFSVTQNSSYSSTQNYLSPVGAFINSASAYGTFDQGGDVLQWTDDVVAGSYRVLQGASWADGSSVLLSSDQNDNDPTFANSNIGFRVATVPSPLSQVAQWLLSNGFASNSNLQSSPNNDGVTLLMDYALNLNPLQNQSANMPQPVISGSQMSLTYFAGSPEVTYTVQSSTDLQNWSTSGVTVTGPDANNNCTATIPVTGSNCFLRLQVIH